MDKCVLREDQPPDQSGQCIPPSQRVESDTTDQLFQLSNQRDSKTNIKIADATADVALLTQRDSASMITIAAVTMLFLPGTFISAILSTTFFDYGDEGLRVSERWWILPATTIPLTIIVFAVWLGWRYMRLKKVGIEKKRRQTNAS
jgi:hypothetical protein